jgi:hypothetical protein
MGCGCIPFDQRGPLTHVVRLTEATYKGIKVGKNIEDGALATEREEESQEYEARVYLYRLPSATRMNYYRHCGAANEELISQICDKSHQPIKSWPEVVAGIGFGGLVPMAALNLVRAVRFTAGGGKDLGDGLLQLRRLMMKIQSQTANLRLFGQYIEDCSKTETGDVVVALGHPSKVDIPTAAATFARYSTILEYITACSATVRQASETEESGGATNIPVTGHNPATGEDVEEQSSVFDACCHELLVSYEAAVKKDELAVKRRVENSRPYGSPSGSRERLSSIGDELRAIEYNPFNASTCGKIARYIILAWTYYVGIVVWNEDEYQEAMVFLEDNEERIYHPVDIDDLPRSSFLS